MGSRRHLTFSHLVLMVLCSWAAVTISTPEILTAATAHDQQTQQAPAPAETQTAPTPVPLADIANESEAMAANLRDIRAELSSNREATAIADRLPQLTGEINARLDETRKILAQSPSIEILGSLEGEWRTLRRDITSLNRNLSGRVHELDRQLEQLDTFAKTWEQTFAAAKESNVPPELLGRLQSLIEEIHQSLDAVQLQRARALSLQTRLSVQDGRVASALAAIDQAHNTILNRLLLRDKGPIWSLVLNAHRAQLVRADSMGSFTRQWNALVVYAVRQTAQIVLGIAVFGMFTGFLYWARRHRYELTPGEDATSAVFEMPIAAAIILTLLLSRWIFPLAPRLFWAMIGALALIPSALILRRLIPAELRPLPYALLICFVFDQLRSISAAVELLPRSLFLVEMLLVIGITVWLIRWAGHTPSTRSNLTRSRKILKIAGYVGVAVSSIAWLASASGYVSLAIFIGNALVQSSYLALILYAILEVLDGLFAITLHMRPFQAFRVCRRHHDLLRHRSRQTLKFAAVLIWAVALLNELLLRERFFRAVRDFLNTEAAVGSIRISAGDVIAFVVTLWAAFLVSRFIRFLLDEEVYPRIELKRGLPYAISHTVHYLILFGGFFLALAALGVDMTRVTIIAGAFSVGVGLGLQNIFNNFISGLILLFERPISIGDIVQIDDASGVVERIGVRASTIRMTNGSEVIMPNGKLISERVINWTLSTRRHGIELPVTVAPGVDPGRVIKLLEKTASAHPLVTGEPAPQALFVKIAPDSFGFELRAWTERSELWMQIRSELAIAINTTLMAEHIPIR